MKCPKCKSSDIGGLMAAFWVGLNKDGSPARQWCEYESETEITEQRLCYSCGHEWNDGDEDGN